MPVPLSILDLAFVVRGETPHDALHASVALAKPAPEADTIDPETLREAVRLAWTKQPLEERRHALSRVVEKVELSQGGLEIICRADGYHGHDPFGPPEGSPLINRGWVGCGEVRRPKRYVICAL